MKKYSKIDYTVVRRDIANAFKGWTIIAVGQTTHLKHEGDKYWTDLEGGLTFILEKDGFTKKVILGYNELGEWLEYEKVQK